MTSREELTTDAIFIARMYYEACQMAEGLEDDWNDLELEEKILMSRAAQMLMDIGVMQRVSQKGLAKLKELGFRSGIAKNRTILGVPLGSE